MQSLKLYVCVALFLFSVAMPLATFADGAQITQIVFTSTSQSIQVDTASGVMTTQTQNATSTRELVRSGTILQYTSTSATGQFSNANSTSCSGTFTGAPFSLTMSTGSANKNFCYRDATAGTHTLTVTAQGQSWTVATQDIVINAPPDTTPPVIVVHVDITGVEATSNAGATVTYTSPDATDNVDATAPAVCTPASGSTFPLGTNQVTCNKTDVAGNSATLTTFSVTVVDTIPDSFLFTDQTSVAFTSEIISNTITVNGMSTSTDISVTGGEYSVNGGAYTASAGIVASGDAVAVRHTSSGNNNGEVATILTIGGVSDTFTTTTSAGSSSSSGNNKQQRIKQSAAPPIQTSPTVEETVATIITEPTTQEERVARITVLRTQALDLMYQWALSLQAQVNSWQ